MKRVNNILSFLALNRFIAANATGRRKSDTSAVSGNTLTISNTALVSFFKTLNERKIRFIICGNMATAFYGHIQQARQIEIWISQDTDNIEKFYTLLAINRDLNEFSSLSWKVKTGEGEDFELTIYFSLFYFKAHDFDLCYDKCVAEVLLGVPIRILHLDHLIIEKIASGKKEEKAAIRALERIQKLQE